MNQEVNQQTRILARDVAHERELTVEELKLVSGGGFSTNNGFDCGRDWTPTFESLCQWSDGDPCDMDTDYHD